ncbi:hypothetical protein MNB_SM-4-1186 [hydrothermal vent metagenome]|uniref:Uncharacterized protein n=1 Tax=hydrothermal vent metagenome TaxID=652676 RepID=A0A1W1CQ57_9ZZZZ
MIKRWLRKYLTTVFVLATLMGVFHQHSDLIVHEDCQICTIASSIADGDMPSPKVYLSEVEQVSQTLETNFLLVYTKTLYNSLNARAPPKFS